MLGEVKRLSVKGEYWITNDGDVIYCDGDAGAEVPNHEMIVVERSWQMIEDGLSDCKDDQVLSFFREIKPSEDELPDLAALRTDAINTSDNMYREGKITEEACDDPYTWLREAAGVPEWVMGAAFNGFDAKFDLRAYAMREWGWIRVAGMNITIPHVTKAVCELLHDGLMEICDTEAIQEYGQYSWSVECIDPAGYVMQLTGGLVTDHKTLREHFIRCHVPGWTTNSIPTN